MQHNATQQCNEKILEKYLGGTSATQYNATVLHGNFTRNKPKCNATLYNTTVQKEDIREYPSGTSATQCNTTVLEGNLTKNKLKCNATQDNTTQHNSTTRRLQRRNLEEQV